MYLDVPFVHRKYLMEVELLLRGNPAFREVRADVPEDSRPSGWRCSSWEEIVADVKNGSKSDCSTFLRNTQGQDGKVASLPDQSAKPLFADWPDHHDMQTIASALDGDGTHA